MSDTNPWNKALDLLSRREHSVYELKQKLENRLKDLDKAELEKTIQKLKDQDLLSDARFAAAAIKQKSSQGYGPKYIEMYLNSKNVSSSEYDFESHNINWQKICEYQISKKLRSTEIDFKEREKISRFLSNRGFNYEIIKSAFTNLSNDTSE